MDGSLIVYDKEKEDAVFVAEENGVSTDETDGGLSRSSALHVSKSVNSKNQKTNPVASWKLSNAKINAFAFSPDSRHLAVVCEDGTLRIIDYLTEQYEQVAFLDHVRRLRLTGYRLTDIYPSYYGGFICVCWSPDGKYVLTGGQDDLVSIWTVAERQIIARCPGHHSWVTAVAFDPWRCGDRNYRFGSVGEDCRLLLWDFNVGMLHRPKAVSRPPQLFHAVHAVEDADLESSECRPPSANEAASLPTYPSDDTEPRVKASPTTAYGPTRTSPLKALTERMASTIPWNRVYGLQNSLLSWYVQIRILPSLTQRCSR